MRISAISDLHMGHNKVDTFYIVENLRKYFSPYIKKSDVVMIPGDITDRDISLSHLSSRLLIEFFTVFFKYLSQLKIPLIIVRGTYSHDRTNIETLLKLNESLDSPCKIYYSNKIDVQHIEELNIYVGFMPDNLPYKFKEDALLDLKKQMHNKDIKELDYVLFHGYFTHMVPDNVILKSLIFDEEDFNFVKQYVLCGHVHTPSQQNKILGLGSFDRLKHNEEERKGFLYIEEDKIRFIENKSSMIFRTLNLNSIHKNKIKSYIDTELKKYNKRDIYYIRLICEDKELRLSLKTYIHNTYPKCQLSFKPVKKMNTVEEKEIADKLEPIHQDNISKHIKDYLDKQNTYISLTDIDTIIKSHL